MFTIRYQTPYNQCEWRTQSFRTLDEAERMVAFYRSCGSPARLDEQQCDSLRAVH
jgi:hypothetical protein